MGKPDKDMDLPRVLLASHGPTEVCSSFFSAQPAHPTPAAPSRESRDDLVSLVLLWRYSQNGKCSPTHMAPCPCHQMTWLAWSSPPFIKPPVAAPEHRQPHLPNPPTRATRGQDPLRHPRSLLDRRGPRGSISRFSWIESSQLHTDTTLSTRVRMPQPFSLGHRGNPLLGPLPPALPEQGFLHGSAWHTLEPWPGGPSTYKCSDGIATSVLSINVAPAVGRTLARCEYPSTMSQCPEPALVFPGFARPGKSVLGFVESPPWFNKPQLRLNNRSSLRNWHLLSCRVVRPP